jgi:hypothetical protein
MSSAEERRVEIQRIVDEAYDRKWAETDRHGHKWDPEVGDVCKCGYKPKRPMGTHARVSVGVHIHGLTRSAEKRCREEIRRRMEETR